MNVLIIDDSAVVRRGIGKILSLQKDMQVDSASDPLIALRKMKTQRPDVIVLDLEMPRMDGLTFLHKIMHEDPIPVVVCSSLTIEGSETALRAMEEGAVEIITKRGLGLSDYLSENAERLVDAVRAASTAHVHVHKDKPQPRLSAEAVIPKLPPRSFHLTTDKVVAIGASTGGTEALREVLESLPPDAPGIVVVQHMPEAFTRAFASRLNDICRVDVKEAANDDRVLTGRVLIAPGNHHLLLQRSGGHYVVRVEGGPLVSRHRPSVDVLFRSVAQEAGANALGVIMTGMGADGADGLLEMRQAGARTVAQDEASCIVFGMPKEAIARGAAEQVLPLRQIGARIMEFARSANRSPGK